MKDKIFTRKELTRKFKALDRVSKNHVINIRHILAENKIMKDKLHRLDRIVIEKE